jgi:DNA repair exonuclease SbcCD ATPase subunit
MITFERVRYQNFLATGNVPIDILLNKHTSTLIVGRNGAGKSTMTEAVCFALFGRALRNINKPALVNSVNKRDALVELWFTIGETQYLIKRGIKPNVFEIYQNGVVIPAPAAIADYQTLLETQILGLNYKSFMQIVVLGSASYVPFMRLSPAARREIIEDILDIEVFSAMNTLAKDELSTLKTLTDSLSQQRTLLDEQVRMGESFTTQITEQRDAQRASIQVAIDDETAQIAALHVAKADAKERAEQYRSSHEVYTQAKDKKTEFETTFRAIVSREKKLAKERDFYTAHDECPTCTQSITQEFKQSRFVVIDGKEQSAQKARQECERLITKYDGVLTKTSADLSVLEQTEREIAKIDMEVPIRKARIVELTKQLTAPIVQPPAVNLDEIRERIAGIHAQQTETAARRAIVDTASTLLKDSGIKSRIIKHYLPIINRQINHYLTAMDFPIHFTLDEQFEEHIQSRFRDDFCYESFSEGEKKRIDLALLLTWRAIARLKNSASCNMLVLDEVFDSSLDVAGTEEFLKIIHALEDANIFVISHKTDSLIDKFAHVLHFEKQRGFSTLRK